MTTNLPEIATNAGIELGVSAADAQRASELACIAGDQPTRFYHNQQHFAFLAGGGNEIYDTLLSFGIASDTAKNVANAYRIAGRDNDVVYVNSDKHIMPEIQEFLTPFIEEKNGVYTIISDEKIAVLSPTQKENLAIALGMFGFKSGDTLNPFNGQNEFLSALYSLEVNKGINHGAKILIAGLIQSTPQFD
jgi:hypothetical protein